MKAGEREYSAFGAAITDTHARVYVGRHLNPWWPMPGSTAARMLAGGYSVREPASWTNRYTATTWDGRAIGELAEVSSWRVPGGWTSGYVHAYQLTLPDGRRYAVRGSGPGMVASGRRMRADAPTRP